MKTAGTNFESLYAGRIHVAAVLMLLLSTRPAAADDAIQPSRDVSAAIASARAQDRPLLFYIVNRKQDGLDRRRQRHRDAFRHPAVVSAAAPFVAAELNLNQVPREMADWGLDAATDGHLVFTTASGRKVHDCGIGRADGLAREISYAYEKFAEYVWSFEIEPRLDDRRASAAERIAALRRVVRHRIRDAEQHLIAEIAPLRTARLRPSSDETPTTLPAVSPEQAEALAGLARLSTPRSIEAVVELAGDYPEAAAGLKNCTPPGALHMAEWLGDGDADRQAAVYAAVAEIVDLKNPRTPRFWRQAPESERLAEIRRARRAARAAALQWQASRPAD
jgi:hypothetical protein